MLQDWCCYVEGDVVDDDFGVEWMVCGVGYFYVDVGQCFVQMIDVMFVEVDCGEGLVQCYEFVCQDVIVVVEFEDVVGCVCDEDGDVSEGWMVGEEVLVEFVMVVMDGLRYECVLEEELEYFDGGEDVWECQ